LKYFNGGQSWATHSSDSAVAGYPLVVGISGDIVGRGRYGTQGGEVTFPRELKLDGKEVTHLFVPDREVPDVSRRLAAHNVTNVQVVGFGAVEPPPYLRQGH
jgi:hypothetical protein